MWKPTIHSFTHYRWSGFCRKRKRKTFFFEKEVQICVTSPKTSCLRFQEPSIGSSGRIGKATGGHHHTVGPQQLQSCLKSNLDPRARHHRHMSRHVSPLKALGIIETGTRWTQLIVKLMQFPKPDFTHISRSHLKQVFLLVLLGSIV